MQSDSDFEAPPGPSQQAQERARWSSYLLTSRSAQASGAGQREDLGDRRERAPGPRHRALLAEALEADRPQDRPLPGQGLIRWKISPLLVGFVGLLALGLSLLSFFPGFGRGQTSSLSVESRPSASVQESALSSVAPVKNSAHPTSGPGELALHCAGAVVSPGLYRLPAGSRVQDLIDAAGGPLPNAAVDSLNLAQLLEDGSKIYLPTLEELAADPSLAQATGPGSLDQSGMPAGAGQQAGAAASSSGLINLNKASAQELESLPGVGPKTAEKIVAWRQANGGFKSLEELELVPGIGPRTLENLRPLVTL